MRAPRTGTLTIDQPIPVGDGTALLARRPDIRAAERRLAASTARIGVATADLYPKINLGASVGSTGTGFGDFFGGGPLRWLLGAADQLVAQPGVPPEPGSPEPKRTPRPRSQHSMAQC
jgi:outer membrane protein TolC